MILSVHLLFERLRLFKLNTRNTFIAFFYSLYFTRFLLDTYDLRIWIIYVMDSY